MPREYLPYAIIETAFIFTDHRYLSLPPSAKLIFLTLWCRAFNERRSTLEWHVISPPSIARDTGVDRRTIAKYLTLLHNETLIKIHPPTLDLPAALRESYAGPTRTLHAPYADVPATLHGCTRKNVQDDDDSNMTKLQTDGSIEVPGVHDKGNIQWKDSKKKGKTFTPKEDKPRGKTRTQTRLEGEKEGELEKEPPLPPASRASGSPEGGDLFSNFPRLNRQVTGEDRRLILAAVAPISRRWKWEILGNVSDRLGSDGIRMPGKLAASLVRDAIAKGDPEKIGRTPNTQGPMPTEPTASKAERDEIFGKMHKRFEADLKAEAEAEGKRKPPKQEGPEEAFK